MEGERTVTLTRRQLVVGTAASFLLGAAGATIANQIWLRKFGPPGEGGVPSALEESRRAVLPPEGYQTSVSFGKSVVALVAAGAIDPGKFEQLYARRGGVPKWMGELFERPSSEPIQFSTDTAPHLLNLLWPLGLATQTRFNEKSPLNGPRLARFASTAGWVLGKESNGAVYFNTVRTMGLDAGQERAVLDVANGVYRPCCNNSTFFQDCNHGSALLGLLELAASQGHTTEPLYALALAANAHWYRTQYAEIALYFREFEDTAWKEVSPQVVLGREFSSGSGWRKNIRARLQEAGLLAPSGPSVKCSV